MGLEKSISILQGRIMKLGRAAIAFLLSMVTAYVFAVAFYTQQVIASQSFIQYTREQQVETFIYNLSGLWMYGAIIAIALIIGFLVAWLVKRVLKPLAPVAYPVAGAVAIPLVVVLIEQVLGGGAGIMSGARGSVGLALQGVAGLAGGFVFTLLRPQAD